MWWVSRVAEEFSCTPSEAIREIRNAPDGLIEDIVEARAFAATWRMWDTAAKKSELPSSPMLDLVVEIDMAVQAEQLAAARQERG